MSTMRHQWLATYLLPESVVDDVMRKRTESMEALGDKESSWGAKPEDTTPTAPEEPEVKPVDTAVTELPDRDHDARRRAGARQRSVL